LSGLRNRHLHLSLVRDVALDERCSLAQGARERFAFLRVHIGHRHVSTPLVERPHGGLTKAGRSAHHDRRVSLDLHGAEAYPGQPLSSAPMTKLSVGDQFPDVALESAEGTIDIRQMWGGMPLVVAFMRHFG
jgi:hypothetical protein